MEQDLYKAAVEKFSEKDQVLIAVEEMAEHQKALLKWIRYGCAPSRQTAVLDSIGEEMVDVEIMLGQLKVIFGEPTAWRCRKLNHLADLVGMPYVKDSEDGI